MPRKPDYPPPSSWLRMPDDRSEELYFWFRGNPFDIDQRLPHLVDFRDENTTVDHFPPEALAVARFLDDIATLGYMAAGKTFLMLGARGANANKLTHGMQDLLGTAHMIVHRVHDPRGKIASTESLAQRVSRVRGSEGRFAKIGLPVVEKFRLP